MRFNFDRVDELLSGKEDKQARNLIRTIAFRETVTADRHMIEQYSDFRALNEAGLIDFDPGNGIVRLSEKAKKNLE